MSFANYYFKNCHAANYVKACLMSMLVTFGVNMSDTVIAISTKTISTPI